MSQMTVDPVQQSFYSSAQCISKPGPFVRPFIQQLLKQDTKTSVTSEQTPHQKKSLNLVEMRQQLPLRVGVFVEREYAPRSFVISLAHSGGSLALLHLSNKSIFDDLKTNNEIKKLDETPVVVGRDYIYVSGHSGSVYRARVVDADATDTVVLRLLDESTFKTARKSDLWTMHKKFTRKDRYAFTARVTLPPTALTNKLGLTDSGRVKEGDRLVMVLLTPAEPHLGVVVAFAESVKHGLQPWKLQGALEPAAQQHWTSLWLKDAGEHTPIELHKGYGQQTHTAFHQHRLAIVVAVKALDQIYVRDLPLAIRLPFLQEVLTDLYANKTPTDLLNYTQLAELRRGMGAVLLQEDQVYRVEVERMTSASSIEVRFIDFPNYATKIVELAALRRPLGCLDFPPLVFAVSMTAHNNGVRRLHQTQLAACLLPDGTPVVLTTDTTTGLVKIFSAMAPEGVLKEIGFDEDEASLAYNNYTEDHTEQGGPIVIRQPQPDSLIENCYAIHPDAIQAPSRRLQRINGLKA